MSLEERFEKRYFPITGRILEFHFPSGGVVSYVSYYSLSKERFAKVNISISNKFSGVLYEIISAVDEKDAHLLPDNRFCFPEELYLDLQDPKQRCYFDRYLKNVRNLEKSLSEYEAANTKS